MEQFNGNELAGNKETSQTQTSLESKRAYGARIERQAEEYLLRLKHWTFLGRNFRCRAGEIDLIFEEQLEAGLTELVFVEVRARGAQVSWVSGIESVDWVKQKRLKRAMDWYLMRYRGGATAVRLDILAWDGSVWEHLRNVWMG